MTPTRWKVYRDPVEQQQDERLALASGWVVQAREYLPDGTLRVTYADSGWRPTATPGQVTPFRLGLATVMIVGIIFLPVVFIPLGLLALAVWVVSKVLGR